MSETRQERFKRLAIQRTNAALDKLRLIGNLANKSNYDYSDEDIKKIFNAIDTQLKNIKSKFICKNRQEFSL